MRALPSTAAKQVTAALQNPHEALVTRSSVGLGTFAGSQRAATARKQERIVNLKTAPKPENKNYEHFIPISGQGSARLSGQLCCYYGSKVTGFASFHSTSK